METSQQPNERIETILFFASLVSKPEEIDREMDTLRAVTANSGQATTLSSDDEVRLQTLQQHLEDYLVNKETLRSFTHDGLAQMLAAHNAPKKAKLRYRLELSALLGITFVVTAIPFMLPLPTEQQWQLASPLFFAAIYLGSAIFYLLALKDFKPTFKRPFLIVCLGIAMMALVQLQVPIVSALNLWESTWFDSDGLITPFIIAFALIYLGLRKFTNAIGYAGWLSDLKKILPFTLAFVAASYALMYTVRDGESVVFYLTQATILTISWVVALCAGLTYRLRKHLGILYSSAFRWLQWSFLSATLGGFMYVLPNIVYLGPKESIGAFLALPFLISAFLLLSAGYSFRRITRLGVLSK